MKRKRGKEKHSSGLLNKKKRRTSEPEGVGHKSLKKRKNGDRVESQSPSLDLLSKMENQKQRVTVDGSKRKKTGSCMKHKKKDKVFRHGKHRQTTRIKQADEMKRSISGDTQSVETPGEGEVSGKDLAIRLPKNPEEYSSNWRDLCRVWHSEEYSGSPLVWPPLACLLSGAYLY